MFKKALPIALAILITTQLVAPFFVSAQTTNRNPFYNKGSQADPVVVNSWDELKQVIDENTGDIYIKINGAIAANKPITIGNNKTVYLTGKNDAIVYGATDNNENIADNKFDSMFKVDGGTLNIDSTVTLSGQRAKYYGDTCNDQAPINDKAVVNYTHSTSKDLYDFTGFGISYTKSTDFSHSDLTYHPYQEAEYDYKYKFDDYSTTYQPSRSQIEFTKQFSYLYDQNIEKFGIVSAYREQGDTTAICVDQNGGKWYMYFSRSPQKPYAVPTSVSGVGDWVRVGSKNDPSGNLYYYFYATEGTGRIYIAADGTLARDGKRIFDGDGHGKQEYRWYPRPGGIEASKTVTINGETKTVTHYMHRNDDGLLTFPTTDLLSSSNGLIVGDNKIVKTVETENNPVVIDAWGRTYHVYNTADYGGDLNKGSEATSLVHGNTYYIQATNGDGLFSNLAASDQDTLINMFGRNDDDPNPGVGNSEYARTVWEYLQEGPNGTGIFRTKYWSGRPDNDRLVMYYDGTGVKATSYGNWRAMHQPQPSALKVNGTQIYKPDSSTSGLTTSAGKPISMYYSDASTQEAGSSLGSNSYYIKSSDGYYLNSDGNWVNSLPADTTNFKWTLDEDGALTNGIKKIYVNGSEAKVVDSTEKDTNVIITPESNSALKADNDSKELFRNPSTNYGMVTGSGNNLTVYTDHGVTEATTLTVGETYYIKENSNENRFFRYDAFWNDNVSNWDLFTWTYNADGTFSHGDFTIHVDESGKVSIVNRAADEDPKLIINGKQLYKGNLLSTTENDQPLYLYKLTTNNQGKYIVGEEATSINDGPFYIKGGNQWLYKPSTGENNVAWGEHPDAAMGYRNYNNENNPYVWLYDSESKTLKHGNYKIHVGFDKNGNPTDNVVNTTETITDVPGNISIGGETRYATTNGESLFTPNGTNSIYMYNINNDGSKGDEAPTNLVLNNYYYLVTEEDNKYLEANLNGGSWKDLENQTSKTNNPFAWKFTEVTRGDTTYRVLYNELTDQFIHYDGSKLTMSPNTVEHCDIKAPKRWRPIADKEPNVCKPGNIHHTDKDINYVASESYKGYFITATNGAVINSEATYKDLYLGRGGGVKNYAPIAIDNSTFNMTGGSIENNWVGYVADNSKSGLKVTSRDYNDIKAYLDRMPMTNTAGGIIFSNGAKGIITGDASIKLNRGDAGGMIVTDEATDVTIGGQVVYYEPPKTPDDGTYYILGSNGRYYQIKEGVSPEKVLPAGVTSDGKMYDARIESAVGGGHIDQNLAFHHAGAALVQHGATLRMVGADSTMNNNTTWAKGGAVWATEFGTDGYAVVDYRNKKLSDESKVIKNNNEDGIFIMTNGYIDNNMGFVRAGGINVESDHVFLIGGTISNNTSRALGGGIYVEGDFPEYTYTLIINNGYVGHNYSVRYWDLNDTRPSEIKATQTNAAPGAWDDLTLTELNDRLDRRLDPCSNACEIRNNTISVSSSMQQTDKKSALNDDDIVQTQDRTADVRDFPNPHEGNGGGIWLCPIGGTAVFHMNSQHEVIIDDNYASGKSESDNTKGTDLYLHSGTGHMLVQNGFGIDDEKEVWHNEKTGDPIPDNSPTYSGPLYLINDTNSDNYNTKKTTIKGVRIIDNISRDGGGIAANGTLIFGLPNDVYRHEAKLDFFKIWPKDTTTSTYPVDFKLFYKDSNNNLVELPDYHFSLNDSNSNVYDYDHSPQTDAGENQNYIVWKGDITIPVTIEKEDENGDRTVYPLYKLLYEGESFTYSFNTSATENSIHVEQNTTLDPSNYEDSKKLYAIAHEKPNTELKIVDWKLVIKEYDKNGIEINTAEFENIASRTVKISNDDYIPIDVIDAGGIGKRIEGYRINFSSITFSSEVKNGKGPEVEKYINNKVHQDLVAFDEIFEYEIMAYVPQDATEVIIYDTLQEPLMFVDRFNKPQYIAGNNNGAITNVPNSVFYNGLYPLICNSNSFRQLQYRDDNDHIGDTTGRVSKTDGWTDLELPITKQGYITLCNSNDFDPDNEVIPAVNKQGNTVVVKIDENSGIESVRGKWVRLKFNAAIKPEYRDVEKLKSIGWLKNEDNKQGSIPEAIRTIEARQVYELEKYLGDNDSVIKQVKNDNQLFAKSLQGRYFQKAVGGDGHWYEIGFVWPSSTSYKGVNCPDLDNNADKDTSGKALRGYYVTQRVFGDFNNDGVMTNPNAQELLNNELKGVVLWSLDKYLERNYDSVSRLKEDNNSYYVLSTKGDYYIRNKDSDGIWYKLGVNDAGNLVTYQSIKDDTYLDTATYGEKDTHLKPLNNLTNTRILFTNTTNDIDIYPLRGYQTEPGYNYPVIQAQEPHAGESNQADYIVTRLNKGQSKYKTNIVTVDVVQPEKYVNSKVHDVLGENNEGYFDQMVEYTILVYVPNDAKHVQIYDTLRPDMMFVDYLGNPQYETYSIGTKDNNGELIVEDVYNSKFMPNEPFGNFENRLITNSESIKENGVEKAKNIYYLLIKNSNNHIGDGSGTASKRLTDDGIHLNEPIVENNSGSFIKVGDLSINTDGSVSVSESNQGRTILINISEDTLNYYDQEGTPIRGNWIQATFRAQIRPSSYPWVVRKLQQKEDRLTRVKADAVDYDSENDTASVVAYKVKSKKYVIIEDSEASITSKQLYYCDIQSYINNNDVSCFTSEVSEALDYNKFTHEAKQYGYLYDDGSGDYNQYAQRVSEIPNDRSYKPVYIKSSGLTQCKYAEYQDRFNQGSGIITELYVKNDFDEVVYVKPSGTAPIDYLELYEDKTWNDSEKWNGSTVYNWEEITDDKNIVKPADLNSEGNHAGLANNANYVVKLDNEYHSNITNTVTIEPKLRELEFTKKWIVDEDFEMPSMEKFKEYLHLWWEKTTNEGTDPDSDKLYGEITNIKKIEDEVYYKDFIEVTYDETPTQSETGTRYHWKITIKNLPNLRPSMKYFVTEDKIPGMNIPKYNNLNDTTTEHVHHQGNITNVQEDLEDETHVEVNKVWDAGQSPDKSLSIDVQLMTIEDDGSKVPAYQRDSDGKIIYEEKDDGDYILASDGKYYHKDATLPNGVSNKDVNKKYSRKVYTYTLVGTDSSPWSHVFNKLPLYKLDENGNKIQKVVNGKNAYLDGHGKEFTVDDNGDVYDYDGTTLLTHQQKEDRGIYVRVNGSVTVNNTISYKIENYVIDILQDPEGYILAFETTTELNHHYKYTKDKNASIYFDESDQPIVVGSLLYDPNTADHTIFSPVKEGACELQQGQENACPAYIESDIEYPTYEIEIVNSKPEIEKYINKDVHLKTYFTNTFIYDILVYVPEEASEIVINDELVNTLELVSFLKPDYDHENIISGYEEIPASQINNQKLEMVVHATNDHTINGTVASKNSAGTVEGLVSVDRNAFSIKINNIAYWGADYIIDNDKGEYIKASDNKYYKVKDNPELSYSDTDSNVLTSSLLKLGLTRMDNNLYTHILKQSSYVVDEDGDYILGSDGNYYLKTIEALPDGVTRVGEEYYTMIIKQGEYVIDPNGEYVLGNDNNYYLENMVPSEVLYDSLRYSFVSTGNINLVGGRYVQVSFKARFKSDYYEQLEQWTEIITSSITPKPELDWDVIKENENQGWDSEIREATSQTYLEIDKAVMGSLLWQVDDPDNITKIVKVDNLYYAARGNDGKVYLSPINPSKTQNKNKWFYRVSNNNNVLNLDGSVADVWEGIDYNYRDIGNKVDNGADIKSSAVVVPIVEEETYLLIEGRYYLEDVALRYLPEDKLTDEVKNTRYKLVDWGRGDGDVIRNNTSPYKGNHAGVVNTASYEVTYGNRIKSTHKSNTVTVVPETYKLPSSGGIGTFLFNILGVMFITMALTEFVLRIKLRRKGL